MDDPVLRCIRVVASDDSLARALGEHRTQRDGWQIAMLEGPPEPGALAIVDMDSAEARRYALDLLCGEGFAGPVLVIGEIGLARSPQDMVLPRPVRLGALLAQIDAHWAAPAASETLWLGPYEFFTSESLLRAGDRVVRLTEFERKLLVYLAEAGGELVGREQLLTAVWGYTAGTDTHTV